ncbi:MAG: hypothetical protein Kow0092_33620 [Deferrisomatales bacterium]
MKLNCWEFKRCGRQPGGTRARELGVCPAATAAGSHGINGGIQAGRICWRVAGTLCEGTLQGTWAQKIGQCARCDFHRAVREEEGAACVM